MVQILKQLAGQVAGGLVLLAIIAIWDWASDGGMISILGGVTVAQFQDGMGAAGAGRKAIVGDVKKLKNLMDDIRQGNGACSWKDVGYDKSHSGQGEWCPAGSFIGKIDLDGCNRGEDNCPVIGRVQCCEIVPPPSSR